MLNTTHAAVVSLGLSLVPAIHTLLTRKAQDITEAVMDEATLNTRVSSLIDRKLGEELHGLTDKLMDETKKLFERLFTEFQGKITARVCTLEEDMKKVKEIEGANLEKMKALEEENSKIREYLGPLVTRINNLEHESKREAVNSSKKVIVIRGLKNIPKDIKSLEAELDNSRLTNESIHITPLSSASEKNVIKISCRSAAARNGIRANLIAAIKNKGLKGISVADYIPAIFSQDAQSLIDKGLAMKKDRSIEFFSLSMLSSGPRLFIKTSKDKHMRILPKEETHSVDLGAGKRVRSTSSDTHDAETSKERRVVSARRTKLFASGSQEMDTDQLSSQ